jgi:hypothetical protein
MTFFTCNYTVARSRATNKWAQNVASRVVVTLSPLSSYINFYLKLLVRIPMFVYLICRGVARSNCDVITITFNALPPDFRHE